MSLCDKDSGLLKTHVHWEDVEEAFSSTYGVPCKMGPNRKLSQIGENKVVKGLTRKVQKFRDLSQGSL